MTSTLPDTLTKENRTLQGDKILLRPIRPADVNDAYVRWMNDPEVTQYLESRFNSYTSHNLLQYVEKMMGNPDSFLFAIVDKGDNRHIGNLKLGPINRMHRRASVGLVIGETEFFGKGVGTEAINLVVRFAFGDLNLHKLTAGCYAPNRAAEKIFTKNGFEKEGFRKQHVVYDGSYIDVIELGLINPKERTDG